MNNEMLSTQNNNKTLKSLIEYIKQIKDYQLENYILYIDKKLWVLYKDQIEEYIPYNIDIQITGNLPDNIDAVYMKKVDWRTMTWYGK